jgi:Uma2 family endonuclease
MPVREPVAEPTWEIVELFPEQGTWTEEAYMSLPGNRLIEFSEGTIEILPMPSQRHQEIVGFLYMLLKEFVVSRGLGKVLVAPFIIRLWPRKSREPDVMFMFDKNSRRRFETYWEGADLVMEVVSPDDPKRDLVTKKAEYAKAKIPEYWLVNPITETITVFVLDKSAKSYREAGVFTRSQVATSVLLEGFSVDVTKVFAL